MFQYSFCSYSTSLLYRKQIPRRVSIQLLFLFNSQEILQGNIVELFQYSFCSYSTHRVRRQGVAHPGFNTASVLIQLLWSDWHLIDWPVSIQLLFLFNKFRLFVSLLHYRFNTASVLIQLLHWNILQSLFLCFNTASVLIQLIGKKAFYIGCKFQYSFCSYSTDNPKYYLSYNSSFNTASVLIQQKYKKRYWQTHKFQYSFCSYSTFNGKLSNVINMLFQYSFCSYST